MDIVTTTYKPSLEQVSIAEELAARLGAGKVNRGKNSIKKIMELYGADRVIVAGRDRISCYHEGGEFFFHPDKSRLRINAFKSGKTDQMVECMKLSPGNTVLDCTLGLATDAIVASYIVGEEGAVTGIESSPVIALIMEKGLKDYYKGLGEDVLRAMHRIKVMCDEHGRYLENLPPGSFDIVYFDPMFKNPPGKSNYPVDPLRCLANDAPLNTEIIEKALKAARCRVVVKESRFSKELERLGAEKIAGGKYSPVRYGIWEKKRGYTDE